MKTESSLMLPGRSNTSNHMNNINDQNLSDDDDSDNSDNNTNNNNNEEQLVRGNIVVNRSMLSNNSKISKTTEVQPNKRLGNRLLLSIVSIALLLDGMLNMVIVPIIPHYLQTLKGINETAAKIEAKDTGFSAKDNDMTVGFLFATKPFIQLIINPFSGSLIDHVGYNIPMTVGMILLSAATMMFAYLDSSFIALFLARGLQGAASAVTVTSGFAMIADVYRDQMGRTRALGIVVMSLAVGSFLSVPFSGFLVEYVGKRMPFILLAVLALADCFLHVSYYYRKKSKKSKISSQDNNDPELRRKDYFDDETKNSGLDIITTIPNEQNLINDNLTSPLAASQSSSNGSTNEQQQQQQQLSAEVLGAQLPPIPIWRLLRDPYVGICAGILVMANVPLAFTSPTIAVWMEKTMNATESEVGIIWLSGFIPHLAGVYLAVNYIIKHQNRQQWFYLVLSLVAEALACLSVPFITNYYVLMIPICVITFAYGIIDAIVLPTMAFLVESRHDSAVYGSVYAIVDISFSLCYAFGPMIAGVILHYAGFMALSIIICVTLSGYAPILFGLRKIYAVKVIRESRGE